MAYIEKRTNQAGAVSYRVQIRRKGYAPVTDTFDRQSDAKKFASKVEREMDERKWRGHSEAEKTTLEEALDRYLREVTPRKKGATAEKERINQWKNRPIAKRFLSSLRGVDFAQHKDDRVEEGRAPSTIRNELNIISHLFNIARKEWGMDGLVNPIGNVQMPAARKGRDRRLKDDEESLIIEQLNYPYDSIVILAIETAMRRGELVSIEKELIDLKNAVIHLPDTKNNQARDVPLSTRAVKTIKALPSDIKGKLFRVTERRVSKYFKIAIDELGIEDLRFHDLRHEATSRLFEKGFEIMEVSAITGHKDLRMLKRYTHLKAADLAKRLG